MDEKQKKRSESMKKWYQDHEHPQKGLKRSSISIELQKESLKDNPRYTCENCGKTGLIKGMYVRWHGDNCRGK